jgi:voltage-gated potassium channel
MGREKPVPRRRSNAYNLFIFVLTIISLVIMVLLLLPLSEATIGLLQFYDSLICIIFLLDFFRNLRAAPNKSAYIFKRGGWLDLLGSMPYLGGAFKYSGLLRLARLSRLYRIVRSMRGQGRKELAADIAENRSAYTMFITILVAIIILAFASVLVLEFESQSPEAKIVSGWDAFWYSIVTITTVGYGDYYPVTFWGRLTAMFIMVTGVGIIGVLTSLLSNMLIGSPSNPEEKEAPDAAQSPTVEQELASIKNELVEIHRLLEKTNNYNDANVDR